MAFLLGSRLLLDEKELQKFYSLCVVNLETGCWNWTGGTSDGGYGKFYYRLGGLPKQTNAHIVSYNHFVGEVPQFEELGHFTQGDKCAFWEHVRPITHADNIREAVGIGRPKVATCPFGHNTSRWGREPNNKCRVCGRIRRGNMYGSTFKGCLACGYNPCRC